MTNNAMENALNLEAQNRVSNFVMSIATPNQIRESLGFDQTNRWREFYDGWFTYFYNVETGERKFKLDPGDILVD